jgi:hypothetical protein
MKKQSKDKPPKKKKDEIEKELTYPPYEDIYAKSKEVNEIDPDDISKLKAPAEKPFSRNEKDFEEAKSGSDLDVPEENDIPSVEDEENDFYSLGGDKHD